MSGHFNADGPFALIQDLLAKRVLFVSYQFPPCGGVGVQRVTKFVKYLPEFGWQSSVLTVANPSVPLMDEDYLRDIPAGTIIRRARTLEPAYAVKNAISASAGDRRPAAWKRALKSIVRTVSNFVLQPDAQILWHPAALREGIALLHQARHDAIVATGPPFSSMLLGARLAKRTGLPLVLDYRDEWGISTAYWENKKQGPISSWIQRRQQRQAMTAADLLLATSPSSAESLARTARSFSLERRSACIYNGFDADDFPSRELSPPLPAVREATRFRLAFVGTLWNLNSIEPLVKAVLSLAERNVPLLDQLELVVAGRRTAAQEALLDRLHGLPCTLLRLPFMQHCGALDLMRSADALLLLNDNVPHANRIINAKVFEYMASRRPIVAIAPRGDVWDIIESLPGTVLCEPPDVSGIAERLATLLEQHRCGVNHRDGYWEIDRFDRRNLAGELAELLSGVVKRAGDSATVAT